MKLDPCFVKSWSTSGDAIDITDSFIFNDTSETGKGGAIVAEGDTNAGHPHHTIEWTNFHGADPMEEPGLDDDLAGLPAVQTGDSYAGSHALYQDVFIPG